MVTRGVFSDVEAVNSEVTAKVLLHKPIAIKKAIAIRLATRKAFASDDQATIAKKWFVHGLPQRATTIQSGNSCLA